MKLKRESRLLLIVVIFIFTNEVFANEILDIYRNPKHLFGKIKFELKDVQPYSYLSNKKLKIWMSVPKDWESQKLFEITYVAPAPDRIGNDPDHGNKIFFWELTHKLDDNKDITVEIAFELEIFEISYTIKPQFVGEYDVSAKEYLLYASQDGDIEITSDLKSIALQIIRGETNPYQQAKKIFNWVVNYLEYGEPRGIRDLKDILQTGKGNCGEYSKLFISLCRAVGIPARMVVGWWAIPGKEGPHVWAEILIPNYGWLPCDPTVSDIIAEDIKFAEYYNINKEPTFYFGHLDNKRLIYSKGSNITLIPAPDKDFLPFLHDGKAAFMQPVIFFITGVKRTPIVSNTLQISEVKIPD